MSYDLAKDYINKIAVNYRYKFLSYSKLIESMLKRDYKIPDTKTPEVVGTYKLGMMYKKDFPSIDLLKTALSVSINWSLKNLNLLYDSFEDNNYHSLNKSLYKIILAKELGYKITNFQEEFEYQVKTLLSNYESLNYQPIQLTKKELDAYNEWIDIHKLQKKGIGSNAFKVLIESSAINKDNLLDNYKEKFLRYFYENPLPDKLFKSKIITKSSGYGDNTDFSFMFKPVPIEPQPSKAKGLEKLFPFINKDNDRYKGMRYIYFDTENNRFVATDSIILIYVNAKHPEFADEIKEYKKAKTTAFGYDDYNIKGNNKPTPFVFLPANVAKFPPYTQILPVINNEYVTATIDLDKEMPYITALVKLLKFIEPISTVNNTDDVNASIKIKIDMPEVASFVNVKKLFYIFNFYYNMGHKKLKINCHKTLKYKPLLIQSVSNESDFCTLISPINFDDILNPPFQYYSMECQFA